MTSIVMERKPRSGVLAVVLGIVVIFVASLATDQVLHVLNVYPPWGEPMWDNKLNAIALSYRLVFDVLGGYVTARLAPHAPMKYAMRLGYVGLVLSVLGVVGGYMAKAGPMWYPIVLAITALPSAWLGGALYVRGRR
ncbi:MAG: hypothetical protein ABJB66_10765 [Gemmatimonadaceae bacterium]